MLPPASEDLSESGVYVLLSWALGYLVSGLEIHNTSGITNLVSYVSVPTSNL